MTTMVSNRRSSDGVWCVQCGDELPVPEWSEYRSDRELHHLWHCWKCDHRFDTIANVEPIDDIKTRDDVFPSLLVA